jgi:hypothetical protein
MKKLAELSAKFIEIGKMYELTAKMKDMAAQNKTYY